ncbi:formate/nitrite transporter, partial [Staphylococcus warneri]
MIENRKSTKDTYVTKEIIETIVGQTQMKEVMADKTPMRYALKSMMAGFLLAIVTVFMLAIKTQFASTHIDGLINLLG